TAFRKALASPPGRLAHAVHLTARHSRRNGRFVRVSYRNGWIFNYPSGRLPAAAFHQTPEDLERDTLDYFCWEHIPRAGETVIDGVAHTGTEHEVPAKTLEGFLAENGIERVDLLKMNIEGAERLVFRGAGDAIGRVEHVAVSCHDFVADDGRGGDEMRTRAEV